MVKIIVWVLSFYFGLESISAQIQSGSLLWLKADYGITDSSGRVLSWGDVHDSSRIAKCPAIINRPYFVKNSINGLPVVRGGGYAQFMEAPSVFPVMHDYSLCYVVQLNNLNSANNTIGGNGHTMYYNPLIVNHGDFYYSSYSYLPFILYKPHIVTVVFNQSKQTVKQYLDGELMDSSYIGSNTDSTLQLGAYQHSNFLIGDLAEFMLYNHEFTPEEKKITEDYLFTKYAIERPVVAYPHSTIFTEIPQDLQLFPRDKNDSAIVRISGNIPKNLFDSILVVIEKNNRYWKKLTQKLYFNSSEASFVFLPTIHAELSEYSFKVYGRKLGLDSLLASRRDIVCGDVILIAGQSNAIQGRVESVFRSEFCRTFGMNGSIKPSDTLWALSTAITNSGGTNVGAWGLRIQRLLMQTYSIPICLINAGEISTSIEKHLPNPSYPADRYSVYGRLLYRVQKAKLTDAVKALIFYQGESDIDRNYLPIFTILYERWNIDYPNLKRIYITQIHPGCIAGSSQGKLRELQRTFSTTFSKIEVLTTAAIFGHLDCHFTNEGYQILGDQFFRLIARDFYRWQDTIAIESPMIRSARFTDSTRTSLALVFSPKGTRIFVEQSYPFKNITAHISDAFITDKSDTVISVSSNEDTVFVKLASSSYATNISYIKDNYYIGTETPYEGPWITNQRSMGAHTFYEFPISKKSVGGIKNNDEIVQSGIIITPNPSTGDCTVEFNTPTDGYTTLKVITINGEEVTRVFSGLLKSGDHTMLISKLGLATGVYFIKLEAPNLTLTEKMIVMY